MPTPPPQSRSRSRVLLTVCAMASFVSVRTAAQAPEAQPPVDASADRAAASLEPGVPTAVDSTAPAPASAAGAAADSPAAQADDGELPALKQYLEALAGTRLLAVETGTAEALSALVARGEAAYLAERYDEAAVLLLEVAESPRFADFSEFDEYAAAESMLAGALTKLGALRTARRYLERVITRGERHAYFGPSVRRYSDVALALGDFEPAAQRLEQLFGGRVAHEDALNELRYLRARGRYAAGDAAAAASLLRQVTRRSRFYANARYLLGAIAAKARRFDVAEQRFCEVADQGVENRYSFYVDDRFFHLRDLSRLGLGRVAHEQGRSDDAFYYYFQVPQDSPKLPEALFEAAYASYEGREHDVAIDLLDQLEARFPGSPHLDEAAILRGYLALSRCDFDQADRQFRRFQARFAPLLAEVDRILANPARQQRLYKDLLRAERRARVTAQGRGDDRDPQRRLPLLLRLLKVEPGFHRLHDDVKKLDAEAARAGHAHQALEVIEARFAGSDRPRGAAGGSPEAARRQARDEFEQDLASARLMTQMLSAQLDAMRKAGAPTKRLVALEREIAGDAKRLRRLEHRVRRLGFEPAARAHASAPSDPVQALLARDVAQARQLPGTVAELRAKLVSKANAFALDALRRLRAQISERLGRAQIGRIDAVMGSKRRIELQIESLATGRFPPELRDPLRIQGLLEDDEEYWPFEGEDWPDEYEQRTPSGASGAEEGGP